MSEDAKIETPPLVGAAKWTAKHDATTRAATTIIEREKSQQDAKTARLRAARLARDAGTAGAR